MTKQQCIDSYIKQDYKLQEIGLHQEKPKALLLKNWQNKPTNTNIGSKNMFAVIQEDNKIVFDFDNTKFNEILNDYLNKTLVVKTGNEGTHYYFKDISRVKPIKTSKLYSKGKVIGDIKAHKSYVIGCGSSYIENGITKEYTKISNTYKVLEIDCEKIIKLLKDNGITTTKTETTKPRKITDELTQGSRNSELLQTARKYFRDDLNLKKGLEFFFTHNRHYIKPPLDESEVKQVVTSAYNFVKDQKGIGKEKKYKNDEWYDTALEIQSNSHIITVRESREGWIYSKKEGVYLPNADTYIDEQAEKLIYKCKSQSRYEIKNTIKSNGTMILARELFDGDIIIALDGILDEKTFEIKNHSPEYLATTKLPFNLKSSATNTKLWRHITRNIIEPKDTNIFLEIIWILLTRKNPYKKLIVFKGIQNTQKTALEKILTWIIGEENISNEKPQIFLKGGDRFSTSKFIGKRANFYDEIGNLTPDMLENLKAMVGALRQRAEIKNSNDERHFDPEKFLFIFSTNQLGAIYSKLDDPSIITRFQFMLFKNVIPAEKMSGNWEDDFFDDDEDKQSAIDTIIRFVIAYKKSGFKTKWSTVEETKLILKEELPIDEKYFDSDRLILDKNSKVSFDDILEDFNSFTNKKVKHQALGILLRQHGLKKSPSGGKTFYKGWKLTYSKNNHRIFEGKEN